MTSYLAKNLRYCLTMSSLMTYSLAFRQAIFFKGAGPVGRLQEAILGQAHS